MGCKDLINIIDMTYDGNSNNGRMNLLMLSITM